MKTVPVMHTNRCCLMAIGAEQLPAMHQVMVDADSQRFLPELYDLIKTDEGMQQMLRSFDCYLANGEGFLWGIYAGDSLIGFIAAMDCTSQPILFYAMHPEYRRKGFMSECLPLVVDYLYLTGICQSLQTEVYNDNLASRRLLSALGFVAVESDDAKTTYKSTVSSYVDKPAIASGEPREKILQENSDFSDITDENVCSLSYEDSSLMNR